MLSKAKFCAHTSIAQVDLLFETAPLLIDFDIEFNVCSVSILEKG